MKIDNHKETNLKKVNLKKKILSSQEKPKSKKKWPQKWVFEGFDKNLIHPYVPFLLQYVSPNGILTFCRIQIFGKNLAL